jgi:glutamate/tyrosine decarboxylase-like PLP-dependent enzyme
MLHYLENIGEQPVWHPIPNEARESFRSPIPRQSSHLAAAHETFLKHILPYGSGNVHPGFFGWVQGGGTPVGMLAEMLAAGMNSNLGGRDHMPLEVERQIVSWAREIFGFPATASGLFVTGTSMANLLALVVARDVARDIALDVARSPTNLTAYASSAVHACIAKAIHVVGLAPDSLRLIPTGRDHRINLDKLEQSLNADRQNGFTPFLIIGTAGTVDIGAIDDLTALANLAGKHKIWFYVDGAYAALAMLSPELAPLLKGIERAASSPSTFTNGDKSPTPPVSC